MFNLFKKVVFLECDIAKRDAQIYLTISKWIEQKTEFKVFLLGRNYREYFDLNYTNCIHFLTPQHYFRRNNNKNIRAIIETEGLLNKNLIHLTFSKNTIKKNSKIFVWGKNTKKTLIKKLIINPLNIDVIGTPRFRNTHTFKQNIKTKKNLGIICRNVSISNFKNQSRIQMLYNSYHDKIRDNFYYPFLFENQIIKDVKDCNLIFKIVEEFKNDKRFNILIRPHPNENPNDYLFLEKRYKNVFIDKNSEFKDWIKKVDAVITPSSSTIIDIIRSEIPIFFSGQGYIDETFYDLTRKTSYSLNKINLKKYIYNKIKEFNKTKKRKNKAILKNFSKEYLNNNIFDLNKFKEYIDKYNKDCDKKFLPKIFLKMLYFDLKFLVSKILRLRNENFDYIYSHFFSNYRYDTTLLKNLEKNDGKINT